MSPVAFPPAGMLHQDHPWVGQVVEDTLHRRVGRLMAVCPEPYKGTPDALGPRPPLGPAVAWLRPDRGGGQEWTTPVHHLRQWPRDSQEPR